MTSALWIVIPAAGVGKRMKLSTPKQYLKVHGRSVLEHTLNKLGRLKSKKILLALDVNDQYFSKLVLSDDLLANIQLVEGGSERCFSVLNALKELETVAAKDDWVLVHDVARPCVEVQDINALLSQLTDNKVSAGGILVSAISSTLKQVKDAAVEKTLDRDFIYEAQTPQVFRFAILLDALKKAVDKNIAVTDEAMAVEQLGLPIEVYVGGANNIKLTQQEDIKFIECILKEQLS